MDSECPVIENVDGNSNKEETIAVNDNEVTSQNDNESLKQNEEGKKSIVNQRESLKKDSVESCQSTEHDQDQEKDQARDQGQDREQDKVQDLEKDKVQATSEKTNNETESRSEINQKNFDDAQQLQQNDKNIYRVKWISSGSQQCGVLTQADNGPCPLISIVNVLSLRGKLSLPQQCEAISAEQLLEFLADLLLDTRPDSLNTGPDFHYNVNDAINILPKLQTGLDVNVRFTGVKDFEYTPECIIFDLLRIGLYHGWLVDPQLEDLTLAINCKSYNEVVESIITGRTSEDPIEISKYLLAEQFLEESASQLTYHGICELNSVMKDGQLAVFFRNNHFSTMCKEKSVLYLLVTDQGFLNQPGVVWETLDNIQGDTVFVDQDFNVVHQPGEIAASPDQDHLLAVSLQQRDVQARERDQEWQQFKQEHLGGDHQLSDEELARRLQQVENAAADVENGESSPRSSGQPQPQYPIGPRNSRDKKCVIL